jgi:hypothetical protein
MGGVTPILRIQGTVRLVIIQTVARTRAKAAKGNRYGNSILPSSIAMFLTIHGPCSPVTYCVVPLPDEFNRSTCQVPVHG